MCYILETRPARRYLKMTFCSECIISNTYTPLDKKKNGIVRINGIIGIVKIDLPKTGHCYL